MHPKQVELRKEFAEVMRAYAARRKTPAEAGKWLAQNAQRLRRRKEGMLYEFVTSPEKFGAKFERREQAPFFLLQAIGSTRHPAFVGFVAEHLLGHPHPTVAGEAAGVLASYGEAAAPAIPQLIRALDHPHHGVCATAGDALEKIGSKAIPALRKALLQKPKIAVNASVALREIGTRRALKLLERTRDRRRRR